jgi:hypothetical protein
MQGYRLYLLDGNGRIKNAVELSELSDTDAIIRASAHMSEGGLELWNLARKVQTFPPHNSVTGSSPDHL